MSMAILISSVFFPMLCAFIGYILSKIRKATSYVFFIAASAIEFILTLLLFAFCKSNIALSLCGFCLTLGVDAFRALYAVIASFLWLAANAFGREYLRHGEHSQSYFFFCMITLSGVIGVFLSGDLFTTFCFFELMSFASYPLVIHERTEKAKRAAETYLGVAVISGMLLLIGLMLIFSEASALDFSALRDFYGKTEFTSVTYAGGILILLGFGAKAGMYPLHIWLPKAHPVAPAPASALLSGILTKTGVFGIIVMCADIFGGSTEFAYMLLVPAIITMLLGALLALFSQNLKRTLACSSMSQIGFILTGLAFMMLLGNEGGLAQAGSLLHMANHSLIKLVLFLCAGTVAMNLHELELDDIQGFGRKKPFLMIMFLIGALSITGIPFFGGYASKTMLHEAIVEYIDITDNAPLFRAVEWLFLISGGLTVAYMTKLFVCIFVEKNANPEKQRKMDNMKGYISPLSRCAIFIGIIPMLAIGALPNEITKRIISPAADFFGVEALEHTVEFFSLESLKGAFISISIGACVYLLIVRTLLKKARHYKYRWNERLDIENLIYRPVIVRGTELFIKYAVTPIAHLPEYIFTNGMLAFINTFVRFLAILFDLAVALLSKTVLKPYVYRFREEPLAVKLGRLYARLKRKKTPRQYAEKAETVLTSVGSEASYQYNSFSFAFAMISLGIIIVLIIALLN